MKELSEEEILQVSGGLIYADTMEGQENQLWIGNAIGAVAGAIGGFFGSIIGGGTDASAKEIAAGTVGGAIAGAINPVMALDLPLLQ